ncbi:MAG: peptide chain release factor N(5)-glutamine methyltransferase [Magnetococcales bacterium]|nr:peptide chain release factor N(5)-glutamine methyltransferase [Magnetococcales bacterium]
MNDNSVWTVRRMMQWSTQWLGEKEIENPRLDTELLLSHSLGIRRLDLFLDMDRPLIAEELAAFKTLIKRRVAREPVAYITESKGFWTLDLTVKSGVLIPRPETELVVDTILKTITQRDTVLRILEIGVGTGAIILSLLKELPEAEGVGVDISEQAIACCTENAENLGLDKRLKLHHGDLFEPLNASQQRYDILVSNPPYVLDSELEGLEPEVRQWEPKTALLGGAEGLDIYKRLLADAVDYLNEHGKIAVEIGCTQAEAVTRLMEGAGFCEVTVLKDYSGHPRVVTGQKKSDQ